MADLNQELIKKLINIEVALPGLTKKIFSQYLLFCKNEIHGNNSLKSRYRIPNCIAYALSTNKAKQVFLFTNLTFKDADETLGIASFEHPLFVVCNKYKVGDNFKLNEVKYKIISKSRFAVTNQVKSTSTKKSFKEMDRQNLNNTKTGFKYTLFYSRNNDRDYGKCYGDTVKQLQSEFYDLGNSYEYAYITEANDTKILYAYSAEWKRFISMIKKKKRDDSEYYTHPIEVFGKIVGFRTKKRNFMKTHKHKHKK